jgi:2-haloacid dehalogenase
VIVVFDIGNVLLRWNPRNLFAKIIPDEARRERFLSTACSMEFIVETDVAEDFSAAVAARAEAFPEFAAELRHFDERWMETLGGPIEANVAVLRRLRDAGEPVHALSNFARQKFALARQRYDFLDAFDTRIISGEVGVAKPARRIYEILFERTGLRPEELLFVDDSLANVAAAEALGMAAIHYREGIDLDAELRARGVLG